MWERDAAFQNVKPLLLLYRSSTSSKKCFCAIIVKCKLQTRNERASNTLFDIRFVTMENKTKKYNLEASERLKFADKNKSEEAFQVLNACVVTHERSV